MNCQKKLVKVGVFDVVTRVLLGIVIPMASLNGIGLDISEIPIFGLILSVIVPTLLHIAVLVLIIRGYKLGTVLKVIYNIFLCLYCFMNLRLIFLSAASTMYAYKMNTHILTSIFGSVHLIISVYFMYLAIFNKAIKSYLAEVRNARIQKGKEKN